MKEKVKWKERRGKKTKKRRKWNKLAYQNEDEDEKPAIKTMIGLHNVPRQSNEDIVWYSPYCLYVCLSISLPLCLSVFISVCLSAPLSLFLPTSVSVCLFLPQSHTCSFVLVNVAPTELFDRPPGFLRSDAAPSSVDLRPSMAQCMPLSQRVRVRACVVRTQVNTHEAWRVHAPMNQVVPSRDFSRVQLSDLLVSDFVYPRLLLLRAFVRPIDSMENARASFDMHTSTVSRAHGRKRGTAERWVGDA